MDKQLRFNEPAFEITKSYRDENGQMFIEGLASTTAIDLTKERMSPEVIAKMATRLVGKPLRSEHGKGWDDKLGEIIKADVVDHNGSPALWIKARLFDWSSKAKDLFKFLLTGAQMGLSVAGKINPGGLVKELVASAGKYIPTYRDVDPTEVSVTDHPANLDTFAIAVAKSLDFDSYDPEELQKTGCIHEKCVHAKCIAKDCSAYQECPDCVSKAAEEAEKPHHLENVSEGDFLDPKNYKYPVDKNHLVPALRYFNQDGQRDADGYQPEEWSKMGEILATKLSEYAGELYKYDTNTEKIIKGESNTEKGVNIEMNKKSNLVSKTIPDEVKQLAKEWGKDLDTEMKKADGAEESTESKESTEEEKVSKGSSSDSGSSSSSKPSSFSIGSEIGGDSSSSSSDSSTSGSSDSSTSSGSSTDSSTDSGSSSTSTGSTKDIDSLMSELASTLSSLKDSLSSSSSSSTDSSSTDSSSGSGSTSSDSGSGSSSTDTKTSTDKAVDLSSTGSASSSDSDDDAVGKAIDSLVQAANTMREAIAKRKSSANGGEKSSAGAKPKLSGKEEASDSSTSSNAAAGGASTSYGGETTKALITALSLVKEMHQSLVKRDEEFAKLVEKQNEAPQNRKGYAIALEKNFTGHVDQSNQDGIDQDLLEKIEKDKEINFSELHKYRSLGIIPEKYKKEYAAKN